MMCVSIVLNDDKDVGYCSCCDGDDCFICDIGVVRYGVLRVDFSVEPVYLSCGLCLL